MGEILPRIWDFTCGFKILLVEFQETEFLEFLEFLEFRRRDLKFWQRNLESFASFNSLRKAKFKPYAVRTSYARVKNFTNYSLLAFLPR
ncbi:hypothetical protein [uncultured Campylobacter sp.]|uniref:hypothetical protein n=1 Tax=uncultured Campylobacter sp. TaxID=218934 RepID=UPI0026149695|nr:hypothetical protein [uncultured Campylobacter sp.]